MLRSVRVSQFGLAATCCLVVLGAMAAAPGAIMAAPGAEDTPTFARDVAPIFQQKCQVCHRPGMMAPMSLLTYQDARPWARSIKQRVASREMPPWHLDKTVGISQYKDDRSLTDDQLDTIVRWVDGGALLGDPMDLPPPLKFNDDEWTIGVPDLIVTSPEAVMPAEGSDWWPSYEVDLGLTETRYARAVETRTSKEGRAFVHHAITHLVQEEDRPEVVSSAAAAATTRSALGRRKPVINVSEGTYLSEYAPGKYGDVFPEGTGRYLKAGGKVRFSMHYFATGKEMRDRTSVGFVLYPKGVEPKSYITDLFMHENDTIDVEPGQMARTDTYYTLPMAARLISFQPHMHLRGKAQCMEAIHLDGTVETLSCVDNFDFNWHVAYHYEEHVMPLFPRGTMLHLISIHDNTVSNRRNPDPTLWVGWGQRSIDDMAAAHIGVQYLEDKDYEQLVAERAALQEAQLSAGGQ